MYNGQTVSKILISDSLQEKRIKYWNKFWTQEKKEQLKLNLQKSGAKYKFTPQAFSSFYDLIDKEIKPINPQELSDLRKLFLIKKAA